MINYIVKISLLTSISYMVVGFKYINDITFLLLGAMFFTLAIIFIYISYNTITTKEKSTGMVLSKSRSMSELPSDLSRTFRYTFEVDGIKYTMPNLFSLGAFEYKIGDEVTLYIDRAMKKAIPQQVIIMLFILSIFFTIISIVLLVKG